MHSWSSVEGCNRLKVVSRVKAFSVYLHTWSEPAQPLALFRLWLSREGSLPPRKLIWTQRREGLLVSASPANTGHRLQMSRARQLGPQHIQSSYYQSEMSLGAADLQPLHRLVQCHSVQPSACRQSSPHLLLKHHLLLRKLGCWKLPNQKHKQGTVPTSSCLISQREDWIPCIWQLRCRQSLYWQN